MIPISNEVLDRELETALAIVTKWRAKLAQGIPGQTVPGSEEAMDAYSREMVSELLIVAGKLETLANIVSSDGS